MIRAKGFTVTDTCAGYGKCVDPCPLNHVKIENGKPSWGKNQGKPRYDLGEE